MQTINSDILGILRDKISIIKDKLKKNKYIFNEIEDAADFISFGMYAKEMGRPLLICINPGENCKPGGNCEEKED
jgi:hypothetical protein